VPHIHNQPEIVTVISGIYNIAPGYEFDRNASDALRPGGFYVFPPRTPYCRFCRDGDRHPALPRRTLPDRIPRSRRRPAELIGDERLSVIKRSARRRCRAAHPAYLVQPALPSRGTGSAFIAVLNFMTIVGESCSWREGRSLAGGKSDDRFCPAAAGWAPAPVTFRTPLNRLLDDCPAAATETAPVLAPAAIEG
jgi:hypothetical protein